MTTVARKEDLARYLQGIVLIGGEGEIDVGGRGPVYVSIIHDGSGYTPGAAIVVDQNQFHDLSNETLEAAFDIMRENVEKDEEYVRELQEEWGDRWQEILTESFDGKSWTFKNPKDAAEVISADKKASELIEIVDSSEEP